MFDNKLRINLNLFSSSRKWNGFNGNIYRQAIATYRGNGLSQALYYAANIQTASAGGN